MSNYWVKREQEHIRKMIKEDDKIAKRIRQKYMDAMNEIQTQIEAFYGRYADREGISMSEARKRVSKLDLDRYAKKAKKYVKEKNFTKRANEEMRLYNATMRINRLQLLRLHIELELMATISDEERLLLGELTKQAKAEYERQAGILGHTISSNEKNIQAIVNSSFLSATWSDRLWSDQAALRSEIDKLLNRGIVQGKNPKELARDLRKTFDTSVYNSERLMRTELARVQTDVQKDSYEQAGFEEYEYIAQIDSRTSRVCKDLDNEIFKVKDMQPGVNAPPTHPHCRSSTASYMSREKWDADLKARGL